MENGIEHALHFLTSAFGIAVALLFFAFALWLVRRLGWTGPLDLIAVVENWLGIGATQAVPRSIVNVEFRDAVGAAMDLGPLVSVTLHNGRGTSFFLHEGMFGGCDPEWIRAGLQVHIIVQGGLVREQLTVRLDLQRQTLFVQSAYRLAEMVAMINHDEPRKDAA
jgi:hypothetical protein